MELNRNQIKEAGIKYRQLAEVLGISEAMVTKFGDDPLPAQYQYMLRHGSKEQRAIRRKTLRHMRSKS